jgi:hypothetical protein
MEILVAKSYQGLPVVEEPYVKSGKTYCKVKMKSGSVKEVRTYTQKEYDKMYPAPPAKWKPQREILGFGEDGYIIIFNGAGPHEEFFEQSIARYHRVWGWYIPSNETVPVLPDGVTAVMLPWEHVGGDNGELYAEADVIEGVRKAREII